MKNITSEKIMGRGSGSKLGETLLFCFKNSTKTLTASLTSFSVCAVVEWAAWGWRGDWKAPAKDSDEVRVPNLAGRGRVLAEAGATLEGGERDFLLFLLQTGDLDAARDETEEFGTQKALQ